MSVSAADVQRIPIVENGEEIMDLIKMDHLRIRPIEEFNDLFKSNAYAGWSQVRLGVYRALPQC